MKTLLQLLVFTMLLVAPSYASSQNSHVNNDSPFACHTPSKDTLFLMNNSMGHLIAEAWDIDFKRYPSTMKKENTVILIMDRNQFMHAYNRMQAYATKE